MLLQVFVLCVKVCFAYSPPLFAVVIAGHHHKWFLVMLTNFLHLYSQQNLFYMAAKKNTEKNLRKHGKNGFKCKLTNIIDMTNEGK